MADQGRILSAVDDYADAVVAEKTVELERQLSNTAAQLAASESAVEELQAKLEVAQAKQCPDPSAHESQPEPARRMYVGACPQKLTVGGFSATASQSVVNRFGVGAAVRAFGGGISQVGPRPADAGHVHLSWDHGDSYSQRPTVTQYKTAFVNLKPKDGVERQHESDAKMRRGLVTVNAATDALVDFAHKAKEARPDLLTVCTFTGWLFSPNSTAPGKTERDKWGTAAREFDVTGVDLDGVHGWPYPDYTTGHIDNILRFLDQFDIEWFAVPELGTSLNTSRDPNGTVRRDWWKKHRDALAATGRCLWIDAYVYESTTGNDMTAPEADQWRTFVTSTL